MNPLMERMLQLTRRNFFGESGLRMGGVAMSMLAGSSLVGGQRAFGASPVLQSDESSSTMMHPPLPGFPHFAPRAKSVIYLHMNGARRRWTCGTTNRS